LFVALVLIIEKKPKVAYLIPSKEFQDSNNNFFISNDVSLMPSLPHWEIKISSTTIVEINQRTLEDFSP